MAIEDKGQDVSSVSKAWATQVGYQTTYLPTRMTVRLAFFDGWTMSIDPKIQEKQDEIDELKTMLNEARNVIKNASDTTGWKKARDCFFIRTDKFFHEKLSEKNETPISVKLGDSFFFHYVTFKNIYSYPEQKQDRVLDEHRFLETFGFVDANGDVSRYHNGEWQHQDWIAPKGQATKQTMKRLNIWLNIQATTGLTVQLILTKFYMTPKFIG